MPRKRRPVYSTDPRVDTTPKKDDAPPVRSLPPEQQTARLRREKKGRRGKTVTVIDGLQLAREDLRALAKDLKRACGTGGTAKDATIELQGDHRETAAEELRGRGFQVKMAGG